MKKARRLIWLATVPPLVLVVLSAVSRSVPELGLRDGTLCPCPDRPNCVSSLATDETHRVVPFPLPSPADAAWESLRRIVADTPRTRLLEETGTYLRYEVTSLIFRFKDDLEFHLRPREKRIDVRSASRVGYSDFGVDRARVEAVRAKYDAWLANQSK